MKRINHIEIPDVGRRCFVRNVDRMFQWKIPDRECLKLRVPGVDAAAPLMVELRETRCELAAQRPWPRDHNDRLSCLDIFICPVSFIAYDNIDIGRIPLCVAVNAHLDSPTLQFVLEEQRRRLVFIACNDDACDFDPPLTEIINKFQRVAVIRDSKIGTHFLSLDVTRVDAEHHLRFIAQLLQQTDLYIGIEAGKNSGGVIIIDQLAAEFEIQLVFKSRHTFKDGRGLFGKIRFVVEANWCGHRVSTGC